jgi:hypothetical protein
MSVSNFWSRFRKQFDDEEWAKLNKNTEFKEAVVSDDKIKAAALADKILVGDAKSKKQAREMKKDHEKFGIIST